MGTLYGIDLVDLAIAVAVLIGATNGFRRGVWLSLSQYVGMVAGVIAGADLTPAVLDALGIAAGARPLAAVLVLVIGGALGSTFGYWLGDPIRGALMRGRDTHRSESIAGAVVSGISVLLTSWFLGLSFDRGPNADLAKLIQNSAVLRQLNRALPPPPGPLAGVEKVLAGAPFPQTFAGLEPQIRRPLEPPASADTPGVRAAAAEVYRVESRGCGGVVTGSAYPVARNYLVTNAHVVAGTFGTTVSQGGQRLRGSPATVVLFDPERDVAVLYAPGVEAPPLADGAGARGTEGAVIGYPGGGDESVEPAVVQDARPAQGRDIYNQNLVTRQIWIIGSQVRPGNSGGPLVDLNGHVLGLVFAASSTNLDQAYALTNEEIAGDVHQGVGSARRVDTSAMACAV